jgi:hypothetical protein
MEPPTSGGGRGWGVLGRWRVFCFETPDAARLAAQRENASVPIDARAFCGRGHLFVRRAHLARVPSPFAANAASGSSHAVRLVEDGSMTDGNENVQPDGIPLA